MYSWPKGLYCGRTWIYIFLFTWKCLVEGKKICIFYWKNLIKYKGGCKKKSFYGFIFYQQNPVILFVAFGNKGERIVLKIFR